MVRILGYGDSVFDDYFENRCMYPGGNALNVCIYAKELGAECGFLGNFADDVLGGYLKDLLHERKINTTYSKTIKDTTTQTCRIRLEGNDRVFVGDEDNSKQVPFVSFKDSFRNYLDTYDVVHLGCYIHKREELPLFKLEHALLSYDLSNEPYTLTKEYYEGVCPFVDFLLFSSPYDEEKTKDVMKEMYALGCTNVLATMGIKGQLFFNGEFYKGTCEEVNALDTCGAGDSFVTAFLYSILDSGYHKGAKLASDDIQKALVFANHFSAQNCMRRGAFGCAFTY